ncbi:hypothetical protein EDD18DRAFT_1103684 [Armillaria luteobubalina]|uniref:Uncharacterized protein n=1 Tax=Armillaria luteobubalina TaxID=153913 RepID=A0AA39QAF1_9AGAR|nr:hypothetical protein EDD18DRAFT_1103684 [Armillaria luteobubalina]
MSSFLSRLSLVRRKVDCVEDVYLLCAPNTMLGTIHMFVIPLPPRLKTSDFTEIHTEALIRFSTENLVPFSDTRPLPDDDTKPEYLEVIISAPNLSDFSDYHCSIDPQSRGLYYPEIAHQSLRKLSSSPVGPSVDAGGFGSRQNDGSFMARSALSEPSGHGGRESCGVPFSSSGGLEELRLLPEGEPDLNVKPDDWDQRVLEGRELPFNPDYH